MKLVVLAVVAASVAGFCFDYAGRTQGSLVHALLVMSGVSGVATATTSLLVVLLRWMEEEI